MRPDEEFDTISAIATPPGIGGIGIVRISGRRAIESIRRIFRPSASVDLGNVPSHTLHHGMIRHPVTGAAVDEVLVSVMRRPRSYTCEDTVEILAHGGPFVLGKILQLTLGEGCRLAEPGEFTKRAFLNGRIDLTEADAVMELIEARTEAGQQAAVSRLRGRLGRLIESLRDQICHLLSTVEAFIDFPEEELGKLPREALSRDTKSVLEAVSRLLATAENGRITQEGLSAVIIGRPNVGKSSLLNRLLGEDRAMVSDIPGTTRDVIEGSVHLEGIRLRIMDTAGLRSSGDPLELEGMRRAHSAAESADLVLHVVDATTGISEEEEALLRKNGSIRKTILVINKADLAPQNSRKLALTPCIPVPTVAVSATLGAGLEELQALLKKASTEFDKGPEDQVMVAQIRHKIKLGECCEHLELAVQSIEKGMPDDMIALDLRAAMDDLGEITGAVTTEDILDQIFNKFCIGK